MFPEKCSKLKLRLILMQITLQHNASKLRRHNSLLYQTMKPLGLGYNLDCFLKHTIKFSLFLILSQRVHFITKYFIAVPVFQIKRRLCLSIIFTVPAKCTNS